MRFCNSGVENVMQHEILKVDSGDCLAVRHGFRCVGNSSVENRLAQPCANNTLAVAIPCHDVVRSDGALSGYH